MSDVHRTLRRVGLVMIAVGVFDIGVMIYCIANGIGYSSSFNIFAVVAGILIARARLGAVRIVTWFVAFYLACLVPLVFLIPFTRPIELWIVDIRLHLLTYASVGVLVILVLAWLAWSYRELRSPLVIQAFRTAGRRSAPPRAAFISAGVLMLAVVGTMIFMGHSDAGAKALEIAREKHGNDYKYYVSGIRWTGDRTVAQVTLYNDHELRDVEVEVPR